MMDDNLSGEVDLDEFLQGCRRCRGDARAIDIHAILQEVRRLHTRMDGLRQGFRNFTSSVKVLNSRGSLETTRKIITNQSDQSHYPSQSRVSRDEFEKSCRRDSIEPWNRGSVEISTVITEKDFQVDFSPRAGKNSSPLNRV